jgi:hypothetical protein
MTPKAINIERKFVLFIKINGIAKYISERKNAWNGRDIPTNPFKNIPLIILIQQNMPFVLEF